LKAKNPVLAQKISLLPELIFYYLTGV